MKPSFWLVDHYRDGSRTHLEPRFSIENSKKALRHYFSGPMTKKQAECTKKYLERIWAKSPCGIKDCPCPIKLGDNKA